MTKKYALVSLIVLIVFVTINLSTIDVSNSLACAPNQEGCIVDKAPSEDFTVKITFKNTGKTMGNWRVNIVFEGDRWSQVGAPQQLALSPGETATLTWNGTVPANATIKSMARLVVYYDDSFKALDWWIRVVPSAELCIKSSTVE